MLARNNVRKDSAALRNCASVLDRIRDCSMPQLWRKMTRAEIRTLARPFPLASNSNFSWTRNLSPNGTSWEILEDINVKPASPPPAPVTRSMVAVTRVVFGHMGAGGTLAWNLSSRMRATPSDDAPGGPTAIQAAGTTSDAPTLPKYLTRNASGPRLSLARSACSAAIGRRGTWASRTPVKGSPSSNADIAAEDKLLSLGAAARSCPSGPSSSWSPSDGPARRAAMAASRAKASSLPTRAIRAL
mmetsp:Transcript_99149/g.303134  ORF Transcript_99149/g.303134 Transcript_99149/m.303134 type:complete len:244 (-) Transcript_99149:488-1219(-)